jgi:DinB superfamily
MKYRDENILYGPPAATLSVLINDDKAHDFASPKDILEGISAFRATRVIAGLPYTIAEVLAHANANLRFNLVLLRDGLELPQKNWPKVNSSDWETLKTEFLANLKRLEQLAHTLNLEKIVYEATETEPAWTAGYKLAASVAKHTAYHLGQIALMKRL